MIVRQDEQGTWQQLSRTLQAFSVRVLPLDVVPTPDSGQTSSQHLALFSFLSVWADMRAYRVSQSRNVEQHQERNAAQTTAGSTANAL